MQKGLILILAVVAIILLAIKPSEQPLEQTIIREESTVSEQKSLPEPELTIEKGKTYTVTLKTSVGDITIELDTTTTPITSNNFIYLAKNNFYNDTIFHRVLDGFMIQGGDPTGTGAGNPGYSFDDEPINGGYTRGTVAMANSGPNTNGSQFFIMHQNYELPPNYVIFGHVTEGLEIVDAIATAQVITSPSGEPSSPVDPVIVQEVIVNEE